MIRLPAVLNAAIIAGAGDCLSASDRIKKKNTRSRLGHIEILMMMKSFYKFLSFYFPPLVIRDARIVKEQGVRSFSKGTVTDNWYAAFCRTYTCSK